MRVAALFVAVVGNLMYMIAATRILLKKDSPDQTTRIGAVALIATSIASLLALALAP